MNNTNKETRKNNKNTHKPVTKLLVIELEKILLNTLNQTAYRKLKFLHSIHGLIQSSRRINRRTLFYDAVPIFGVQSRVDSLTKKYTKIFECKQEDLHLTTSLKGVFHGRIVFILRDSTQIEWIGKHQIPDMDEVVRVIHGYDRALVIEKDTIFSRVAGDGHLTVCGKGYPCQNTLRFLKMLEGVKMDCLTDFDPYGLDIFLVYKKNLPGIKRIGLSIKDILRYKVKKEDCIELNYFDRRLLGRLRREEGVWEEAEFIEGLGMKMELEILLNRVDFDIFDIIS